MKEVFLLMKYYIDPEEKNFFPKFDYQISALESMGFNVYYLGIRRECIYLCNKDEKKLVYKTGLSKVPGLSNLLIYNALYNATTIVFNREKTFDLAYIRYMPYMPSYAKALKSIKISKCKIVTEIPTYPIEKEIDAEKRIFRRIYFKLSNRCFTRMSKYVDLFALIGESSNTFAGKPAINIENGITLKTIPLRTIKHTYNDEIHLLALANIAKWHGYDRVIEGLKQYRENGGNKKVVLHLVGSDGDGSLKELKALTKKHNLEDNVFFEGPKFNQDLDWFFDNCHLAIGSIGIHRSGYKSAATLKIREYMARGIPFVMSASDQAIISNDKFYINIPGDDSPVDIKILITFVDEIDEWEDLSKSMRKYAKENMTWERQFSKIFEIIYF